MKCYFDGSTAEDLGWLTIAGYAASDQFWDEFSLKWERMLRERYPIAPYVHMWELLSGDDPFERLTGWTDVKLDCLITDAVKLIAESDKRAFCSVVTRVDLEAHAKLIAEGWTIDTPAAICGECCLGNSLTWYAERFGLEKIYIFYDKGELFFGAFRTKLEKETAKGKTPNSFWASICDVQAVDMRDHPAIQAADIIAWAESRSLSRTKRPYQNLAQIIWNSIPQTALIVNEQLMRARYSRASA